jgi:hypothetical protein
MSASIDASSACAAARCVPVPALSKEGGAMNANAIGGARVGAAPWKDCSHVHAARPSKSRHASAASGCCPCAARSACPNAACSAARSAARPAARSRSSRRASWRARRLISPLWRLAAARRRCTLSVTVTFTVGGASSMGGNLSLVGWQWGGSGVARKMNKLIYQKPRDLPLFSSCNLLYSSL